MKVKDTTKALVPVNLIKDAGSFHVGHVTVTNLDN